MQSHRTLTSDRLDRIVALAWSRVVSTMTRASGDERLICDGGRHFPRYRAVDRAKSRWRRLNDLRYALRKAGAL